MDNKEKIVIKMLTERMSFDVIEKVCGVTKAEILEICKRNDWALYCKIVGEMKAIESQQSKMQQEVDEEER